jgi:predicted Na+-dependent transporter
MPPAIALITYTYLFKGDIKSTMFTVLLSNLFSFFIIPFGISFLFDLKIDILVIMYNVIIGLIFPIGLSFLIYKKYSRYKTEVFDLLNYFFLFFLIAVPISSLKHYNILENFDVLLISILIIKSIILPLILYGILKFFNFKRALYIPIVFLSTFKNTGFAVIIGINYFNNTAVIFPALLSTFFDSIFLIVISFLETKVE